MNIITASVLYAGPDHRPGAYRCYYCGAECAEEHLTKTYVKDTFTNRDIVKFPGSPYVCVGCVQSMGAGDDRMVMIDGTVKIRENARGMQPRMYSWVLTESGKVAATKAHVSLLREAVLDPPDPPFSIILSDSGQKQLIFRAPVAMDQHRFPVLLEDEVIEVDPEELEARIALAGPVVAALGKPALQGEVGISSYIRYAEYHGNTEGLEAWLAVREHPLSRLAAWLSPNKEDSQREYPKCDQCARVPERGRVAAETGRTRGPQSAAATDGAGSGEGRGGQLDLGLAEPLRRQP